MMTTKYIQSGLISLLLLAGIAPSPVSASAAGSLIKSESDSAVYFVASGKRYSFPNERVFKSWYADFSGVATVSNAELAKYPLVANVTYRPGSKLVKIATDPKVYAVSRYGVLRWVMTEASARQIYGYNWSQQVHDLADTFFINYLVGSPIGTSADYNPNEEMALAGFDDNIRPANFVAPILATTAPPASNAYVSMSLNTSEATLNQIVQVTATVENNTRVISKIEIYDGQSVTPLHTCINAKICVANATISQAPLSVRYRATAYDDANTKIETPADQQAPLNVSAVSPNLIVDAQPMTITNGSRANWTSNANAFTSITSHKVFALIPGEPNPVLLKDCGANNVCASSDSFYRTTQLFSKLVAGNQVFQSASITITANGTAPKPTLTLLSKPASNQAQIQLTAPTGESIGWSTIVEGIGPENDAVALCEYASCEITVQVGKATSFTGYTDVGGKLEGSNTLYIEP